MPLVSIYKDFLKFIDASGKSLWTDYERLYFAPHRQFLSSYWKNCMGLGFEELRGRVEAIKPGDYSHLVSLLRSCDLESVCFSALQKCSRLLQWDDEPMVYLMVGFFSPDGFVITVDGKPVIGIGLERYRSFRNIPVMLAHECCHYMQCLAEIPVDGWIDRCTVGEAMLREGICVAFSRMVFPERPLTEHLGMSRGRLNWMRANEKLIWQTMEPALNLMGRDAIQQYLYGAASSGRGGLYIGFRIAEEFLISSPERNIKTLLGIGPEEVLKAYTVPMGGI